MKFAIVNISLIGRFLFHAARPEIRGYIWSEFVDDAVLFQSMDEAMANIENTAPFDHDIILTIIPVIKVLGPKGDPRDQRGGIPLYG